MAVRKVEDVWLIVIGGLTGLVAVLWAGGALSALVCGHAVPHASPLAGLLAFRHLSPDPPMILVG